MWRVRYGLRAAAVEDVNDEIEAVEAAVAENAGGINAIINRIAKLESYHTNELPSDFTSLNYLESSGEQFIVMNYKPNNNTKVIIKFQTSQDYVSAGLIAADSGWLSNGYGVFTGYIEYGESFTQYNFNDGFIHTIELNENGQCYKDGVLIWTGAQKTFQASYSFTMFCLNRGGTKRDFYIGKIYECQVIEKSVLKHNLRPCVNPFGEYGIYDTVEKQFYGNAGTGSFTGG